ncbi:MAG TPA: O-antigen ligase family protein [Terracidiphilus sp.]|nr:O-antigen ligase family protein [Terracidiphilus sp.]
MISARWLNRGSEPGVLAGFCLAAALGLVVLLGVFGVRNYVGQSFWDSPPLRWVILYLAFSGCSLFWTASVSVASSALYWMALAGDVGIVILLVRDAAQEQAAESILLGFIAGGCGLAAIAWMMHPAVDLRLGDVDYFNTNQIGNLCALSLLMCFLLSARGRKIWRMVPWFLAVTLLRSLSKATLAAFIVCLLYLLARDSSFSRRRKWLLVTATIMLTLGFWGLLSAYYDQYTTAGNQAETLTGRTAIWIWSYDAAMTKPWFGNGFDSMWKVAPAFGGELFEARHAENELLQQFFAYGVCGIVLLAGIYGSLYRSIRAVIRAPERVALTTFLIYVVIRGLAEAEPFDLLLPLWLVTALALLMSRGGQEQSAPAEEIVIPAGFEALPTR